MKKIILVLAIIYILVLLVPSSSAFSNNCYHTISPNNLNSNEYLNYLKKHHITMVTRICHNNTCVDSKYYDQKRNLSFFLRQYSDDQVLKGIRIDQITYFQC